MRGKQIASTRTWWRAENFPTESDIEESDIVCVVKKTSRSILTTCRNLNKIVVLDVVDMWPQPKHPQSYLNKEDSQNLIISLINEIKPDALIYPNFAMWSDFLEFFPSVPSTFIYHHYRQAYESIDLEFTLKRPKIVAYEGGDYLAEWHPILSTICEKFGLRFEINPGSLTEADCLLSARGKQFQTYLNCNYKSNVKSANALGLLKPFICLDSERSAHETDTGSFLFFNDSDSLGHQLSCLVDDRDYLKFNHEQMLSRRSYFSLNSVASEFELFFCQVLGYSGRNLNSTIPLTN